ncbi:MAG TPA: DUF1801 domain-containing protein [Cytophagales bacterium]|nr:DUF1801 domain-containing protein [Cytophagales bacterium]HAA22210.1 DUF1801 domain-containing protein [Cytophagales bacterium]HAP63403.1 DUF1801 domain-containing protein [Cytophagales bacterium]
MNKFQPIKFHSIEDFLEFLPDGERIIVDKLRQIIWDCLPDGREKLSYNVPYFSRHRRIVFIWPASVPWGKVALKGVQIGFCEGHRLQDEIGFLEKGNRKQVATKTYFSPQEINEDLLRAYLYMAIELDDHLQAEKRSKSSK